MVDEAMEAGSNESDILTEFVCVFWEYRQEDGVGRWSEQGCSRIFDSSSNDSEIVCACNHLTSFAVLIVSSLIYSQTN